jgi:hypothetical protein
VPHLFAGLVKHLTVSELDRLEAWQQPLILCGGQSSVKAAVRKPLIAVGLITEFEQAEAIVSTGDADLGGRCNFVSPLLSFVSMTLQASTYHSSSARVIQGTSAVLLPPDRSFADTIVEAGLRRANDLTIYTQNAAGDGDASCPGERSGGIHPL